LIAAVKRPLLALGQLLPRDIVETQFHATGNL